MVWCFPFVAFFATFPHPAIPIYHVYNLNGCLAFSFHRYVNFWNGRNISPPFRTSFLLPEIFSLPFLTSLFVSERFYDPFLISISQRSPNHSICRNLALIFDRNVAPTASTFPIIDRNSGSVASIHVGVRSQDWSRWKYVVDIRPQGLRALHSVFGKCAK